MIVGPTGGGKTVIIQTLVKAQTSLGLTTKLFVLNPKVSVYRSEKHISCLWCCLLVKFES
jgi:hypothetical protein